MLERRECEESGHLGKSKLIRQRRISQSMKFTETPSKVTLITGHFIDV